MRRQTGLQGEEWAVRYLRQHGYSIIGRNYYTRYGEIDIICEKERILIFVEVKTRSSQRYGSPEEAIGHKKIEHIKKTALHYLAECQTVYKEIRFDVISIIISSTPQITHIKSAF